MSTPSLDNTDAGDFELKGYVRRYLQQSREGLVGALEGLSDYDVRRPLVPSGTNLLGLIKHLIGVELGYLNECVGRATGIVLPWDEDGSVWDGGDMWALPSERREDLVGLYATVWEHSDATIAALPLDAPGLVPWWPEERRETTFGHLLIRTLDDTARHAGHADLVRELIDGRGGSDHDDIGDEQSWREFRAKIQAAADEHR